MSVFFKPHTWLLAALPRLKFAKGDVSAAARCPRCDPTRQAMDYVRHQWIAAGIDRQ